MEGSSSIWASVISTGAVAMPAARDSEARCAAQPTLPAAADLTPNMGERLAYQLGLRYGVSVALRNILRQQKQDETQIISLSSLLGVAPPSIAPSARQAYQMVEFATFAETDPQCIAWQVSKRFGTRSGALYQFGLYAGYAIIFRVAVGGAELAYVPELSSHGKHAALPQQLIDPLVITPDAAQKSALPQLGTAQTQAVDDYLSRPRTAALE
jgi:hypothetical protein